MTIDERDEMRRDETNDRNDVMNTRAMRALFQSFRQPRAPAKCWLRRRDFRSSGFVARTTRGKSTKEGADASRVAEHKMHLKRVKRRMIAAIQTTRIKWAVRCINSACPREGEREMRR